jgi:DNA polymerase I-like protein with 3'-5' exonuclease and polymerase domains
VPLIQCDAKGLEIYCGAYLSQDKVLMEELVQGLDIHRLNQEALGLPPGDIGRLIAKIFIFRLMYGGSAYSYAHDSDFMGVSTSEKFWQAKIDAFYNKYKGFRDWHIKIVRDATRNGYLLMPTGRRYDFELVRNFRGELEPPQTTIKNYPVQGLGADVMAIARVSFKRRWNNENVNGVLINTVHDSIVCDIAGCEAGKVANLFHSVFMDLPANFKRVFGVEFNLPLRCEVKYGKNMLEMEEYKLAA